MGTVQGLQVGDGGGVCGGAQYDSAWESSRGATDLENLGHGGRAVDVLHGRPGQRRPTELPSGGMPRSSGNEYGDAGPFTTPACPGHRGCSGGGKPPPPTVPLMRHAGPLADTERKAPCHISVCQVSGAKETAASGGGDEG